MIWCPVAAAIVAICACYFAIVAAAMWCDRMTDSATDSGSDEHSDDEHEKGSDE